LVLSGARIRASVELRNEKLYAPPTIPTQALAKFSATKMNDFSPKSVAETSSDASSSRSNRVNTLLCTNVLFQQHAAVCVASLLANNPDLFFDIVIVAQSTEKLDEAKLRRSLTQFKNYSLRFITFSFPQDLALPLIAHYTIDTYTRLWIKEFFPKDVKRVLYLDADIVVVDSIAPLWSENLNGALLGAVDIPGSDQGVRLLGLRQEDGYFNAGVLLIDLEQWRAIRAEEIVLDYIRKNPDRIMYDQDALNACFYHCTKRLDFKWNVIRPFYREPVALPLEREKIEEIRREARIIHFNGGSKPWSYFCDHPRRGEYHRYLRMTDWRDYVPPDRTALNIVRKAVSAVLPNSLKHLLKMSLRQLMFTGDRARSPE
jgi:lipopolysaccharide biosynthesis glycosyltransferase